MIYRYETHCHTSPVSRCARATVRETVSFYKSLGYDGMFLTNHFLDGNINIDPTVPYEDRIRFYFRDVEEAREIGKELGIKVFPGVELTYGGSDFLVYGLPMEWYLAHPEIMEMRKTVELPFMKEHGALIIHAHPFREAGYIDHIRLYPRSVEGVEVYNAEREPFCNHMAEVYAENYGFFGTAGSDNHIASLAPHLGGVETDIPLNSVEDFIRVIRSGEYRNFSAIKGEDGSFAFEYVPNFHK